MIRIRHLPLPAGLSAFVREAANGDLEVFVSDTIEPARARAAVRLALRTFRPASRRVGLLPVPLALAAAGGRFWLRGLLRTAHAHLGATAATAAGVAVAAGAVLVVAMPGHQQPGAAPPSGTSHVQASAPAAPSATGSARPAPSRSTRIALAASQPPRQTAGPAAATSPAPGRVQPTTAGESSAPAPQPSTAPTPQPSTTPAPQPSTTAPSSGGGGTGSGGGGGGGICVGLLGLKICL